MKIRYGFAVFAQFKGRPVLPVDFDLCDRGNDEYEEIEDEKYLTNQLRYAKNHLEKTTETGEYDAKYIGKQVQFTVFGTAKDARNMMEAQELGQGGAGQASFLYAFEKMLYGNGQIDNEKIREDLECEEFAVYRVIRDWNGVWILNSGSIFESKRYGKYTKKQIQEAISYWKGVLKKMNESVESSSWTRNGDGFLEIPDDVMYEGLDAVLDALGKTRSDITKIYFGLDHYSRNSGGDYYEKDDPGFAKALNDLISGWDDYVGKGVPVEGYGGGETESEGPTWLPDARGQGGTLNVPVDSSNCYTLYFD